MAAVSSSSTLRPIASLKYSFPATVILQRNFIVAALPALARTFNWLVPWPAQPETNQVLPSSAVPCHS